MWDSTLGCTITACDSQQAEVQIAAIPTKTFQVRPLRLCGDAMGIASLPAMTPSASCPPTRRARMAPLLEKG